MKVTIALLALVAFAQIAAAQSDSDALLFDTWRTDSTATVHQQRTLLQGGSPPRYSPSPAVYSPSPAVYSPIPVPSPVPGRSPKPCRFTNTANINYYSLTIRSTKNWGAGRDAIVKAAAAVYKKYSQPLKVKVTGAGGQKPQKPDYDFTYLVAVPVTPCAGFKEGLRNSLRNAIKTVKAKGQKELWFSIIA